MKTKPIITDSNQHVSPMKNAEVLKKLVELKKKFNRFDLNKMNVPERDF